MADIDLPVFSIVPNWRDGITETLEWKTDVMRSALGYEQRRSLRLTPRRYFDARFNPIGSDRSFLSQWIQRFGEQDFLLPLWHDQAKLIAPALTGAARLEFDNTYREFWTNGLALLRRGTFSYEVVEIAAQDDEGLDLVGPLAGDWEAGTTVYPLRVAMLESPTPDLAAIVSRVGNASIAFQLVRENPYDVGAEPLMMHEGYPVIVEEPNRASELRTRFERIYSDVDGELGRPYRGDEAGRAFVAQPYDWRAVGRQQHHELRSALYRLNGRQKAVWMPTWNQDAVVAGEVASGADRIEIGRIGYTYLGGPVSGRDRFLVEDATGTNRIIRIGSVLDLPGTPNERVNLTAPTSFVIPDGAIGSFIELMRLDQDSIEITHHADSDGVCEAAAAFRAYRPGRVTAGPLVLPPPPAVIDSFPCSQPHPDEETDCNFTPEFEGWYVEYLVRWSTNIQSKPGCYVDARPEGSNVSAFNPGDLTPDGYGYLFHDYNPDSYPVLDRKLQLQFGAGTVPGGAQGTFQMRRWDQMSYSQPQPYTSSEGASWVSNPFPLKSLWPINWRFIA